MTLLSSHLKDRIHRRDYTAGVIGLGYVGLPVLLRFGEVGFRVLGFDIDPQKVKRLNAGENYIQHLPGDQVAALARSDRFEATVDFTRLGEADALIVCVPTPLTRHREPDLKYVVQTADAIARSLLVGQLISLGSTKPLGFQAFYPGPGLGGHCIPIDPFYLTWKAREYGMATHFIELAGQVNCLMPTWVVGKVVEALNARGKPLNGANVLVLGVAYKKDIDDQRESPALEILTLLRQMGARVNYSDPHVPRCHGHRHYPDLDLISLPLTAETLKAQDALVLVTNHSAFDLGLIRRHATLIIDTRNAFKGIPPDKVVRA